MESVRIVSAAVAHPTRCISQAEAARQVGALAGDSRRAVTIGRATQIVSRRIAQPPTALAALGGVEERNQIYQELVVPLARDASTEALGDFRRDSVGCLVTSSCTGYSVPGWGVQLVEQLNLSWGTARLPITEAGCAGGVVALAHAANYLRIHPGNLALAVAVELCSLSFHPGGDDGNLISSLVFGDGAGCCVLATGQGQGLKILDSMTVLIPDSRGALGFDLTGNGFYPILRRELTELWPPAVEAAARQLLARNGLVQRDVRAWLVHPGGARILSGIETKLGLQRASMRWSWESMAEYGNTSSAAIFDVIRRYLETPAEPGPVVIAAFGPGVSLELLLVERQ